MPLDTYGLGVRVDTDINGADKKLGGLNDQALSLVKNFARATVGIASFSAAMMVVSRELKASYEALNRFNEGMGNVGTLIPGNTARLVEFKDVLKEMSVESGKSLDDLTDGLYQVISAFGDSADTQEKLNVVTKAGIAGMATTTDSLNLLSAVTKAYGDTSSVAMQKVSDLSFLTVKLGQTTFPELAGSIQQVTDSAVRMGVSQEELFAGFATLTGVSGSAAEVATQLRAALVALEGPSTDLARMYEEIGVASGKAFIEQYGFQGALAEVLKYSDKTGVGLQALLGRVQAMSAASNLGASQAETYAWKLGEINEYSGATDEALAEVTDGVNKQGFALKQLSAQYEVLKVNIGERLQPIVGKAVTIMSNMVGAISDNSFSVYTLTQRSQDLVDIYRQYGGAIDTLIPKIGNMTEADKVAATAKELLGKAALNERVRLLGVTFTKSANDVQAWKDELLEAERQTVSLGIQQKNLIERASKESKTPIGITGISAAGKTAEEQLEQTNLAIVRLAEKREALQKNINNGNKQMESDIQLLAKAVADEVIPLSLLALTNNELYEKVKLASEAIEEQRKVIAEPIDEPAGSKSKSPEEVLEALTGFSAKQLKEQLAFYQKLKEDALRESDGTFDTTDVDKIILGLGEKITAQEKEYVSEQKLSLQAKLNESKATGGLSALEAERLNKLAEINDKIGENAELTALVNQIYEAGADILEETYQMQLADQELAAGNANVLVDIERERTKALKEQKDLGLDTVANQERLNAIYDKQKETVLETALKQLQYNNSLIGVTDLLEKNEIEKAKAIEDSNKKYGYQKDLVEAITAQYDAQANEIKKQESYYAKLERSLKGAIGASAYKQLEGFGRAIVKTGQFVQDFSMVWDSLGSAISAYQDTQQQALDRAAEDAEDYFDDLKNGYYDANDVWIEGSDDVVDKLEEEKDERLDALQEMYDADTISYEDYIARKAGIDEQYEKDKKDALRATIQAENDAKMARFEAEKAQFEVDKRTAIANAIMSGAQGIMAAWARGPIAGAIGSGIIAGAMAYQIAQINQQPAPSPPTLTPFAEGGIVTGPTQALIGEAGEPEAVVPLSKASDFGFGGGSGDTYNISGNTFVGVGGIDELILMMEQRKKALGKQGRIA